MATGQSPTGIDTLHLTDSSGQQLRIIQAVGNTQINAYAALNLNVPTLNVSGASSTITDLVGTIESDKSTLVSSDTSLTTRVAAEEAASVAADGSLTTRVAAEEVARAAGDTSLSTEQPLQKPQTPPSPLV